MKRILLKKNIDYKETTSKKISFILFLHLYNISQLDEWINGINKFIELNIIHNINLYINIPLEDKINDINEKIVLTDNYTIYDLQNCLNDNNIGRVKFIINECMKFSIKPIFIISKNKGVDIGGFFHFLKVINDINFNFLIKMHTKSDNNWRRKLMKILYKSYKYEDLYSFDLIGTMIFCYPSYKYDLEINESNIRNICYSNNICFKNSFRFVPGTIFICSKKLIDELKKLDIDKIYNTLNDDTTVDNNWINIMKNNDIFMHNVKYNKIDIDSVKYINYGNNFALGKINKTGIRDGMIEHAWERVFGLIAENIGGNIKQIYL